MPQQSLGRFADLTPILRCPVEKTMMALVPLSALEGYTSQSDEGPVAGTLGAFVPASGARAFPVVGDVVSFLERDVLWPPEVRARPTVAEAPNERIKRSVQGWYDQFGWTRNRDGLYHDTALFSQDDASGYNVYEQASHLSFLDRLQGGRFLLDAASGAIAQPEYQAYSWRYRFRVCVDLSATALQEAAAKVGAAGFCCLADITNLPFQDNALDGVVSGYTIQHIPEEEQARAVEELYRVLRPGAHLCIMTDIVPRPRRRRSVVFAYRAVRKVAKILALAAPFEPAIPASAAAAPPHKLYFRPRDLDWWTDLGTKMGARSRVEALRSLTKNDFESVFGRSCRAARIVRAVETLLPRVLAPASPYCLVDFTKPVDAGRLAPSAFARDEVPR